MLFGSLYDKIRNMSNPGGEGIYDGSSSLGDGFAMREPTPTPEDQTVDHAVPEELPTEDTTTAPFIIRHFEVPPTIEPTTTAAETPHTIHGTHYEIPEGLGMKLDRTGILAALATAYTYSAPLADITLEYAPYFAERPKPKIDGSEYVAAAFGGFGPGSPEYDTDSPRVEIVIPSVSDSIAWFDEAEVPEDDTTRMFGGLRDYVSSAKETFQAPIHVAEHPGVKGLAIEFIKTRHNAAIRGTIQSNNDIIYATKNQAPEETRKEHEIDVMKPATALMRKTLESRLKGIYGDALRTDDKTIGITLEDGTIINIDTAAPFSNFTVSINTQVETSGAIKRFGGTKPTPKQLKRELFAIKEHFPVIADAYAEFFRAQLPKTTLRVEYTPEGQETLADPTDPQRLKRLRQDLVVQTDDSDFRYIGGIKKPLDDIQDIALALENPDEYGYWGTAPPSGLLLVGPPGVGKTEIAKAYAHKTDSVLLKVTASVVKNAFHGETERNIRGVFAVADELIDEGENVVILFDEIEALAPTRGTNGSSGLSDSIVAELLQAMNTRRRNCILIAASNRPDMADPALLRPGRFDRTVAIDMPDKDAREDIIGKLMLRFTDKAQGNQLFDEAIDARAIAGVAHGIAGSGIFAAIERVLGQKANHSIRTKQRANPVTTGELIEAINAVVSEEEPKQQNYL